MGIILLIFLIIYGIPPILTHYLITKNPYDESYSKKYAGFWMRFAAGLIDGLILAAAGIILSMIGLVFLTLFIGWLYYSIFHSSKYQATLGMMVLRVRIYNELEGRISFGRATGRYFTSGLSAIILFIGFFMIGWTIRKQGLHDKIARTIHLVDG
tara:strand:+ start:331 stop:795 length:465 start_codon:yes stop_codon:yes gene_type:complete